MKAAPRRHRRITRRSTIRLPTTPSSATWILRRMSDTAPIQHRTWLTTGDFTEADEPLRLFAAWFEEAKRSEPADPNAMALATVDAERPAQRPDGAVEGLRRERIRLLHQPRQPKGAGIGRARRAPALSFHWKSLNRQVRVRGSAEQVTDAEADAYFATRPRMAQIGAWASKQSAPLESRLAFEKAVALMHRTLSVRRGPAAALLVRLSRGPAGDRVLAGAAVPAARSRRVPPRPRRARRGPRPGSIRELVYRAVPR